MPFDSPLYKAGVAQDDPDRVWLAGFQVTSMQDVQNVLQKHQPGARLDLRYVRRSGEVVTIGVTTEEDPQVEIVPVETTGAALSPEQRQARAAWLAPRAK